jgi:hypothetical protein
MLVTVVVQGLLPITINAFVMDDFVSIYANLMNGCGNEHIVDKVWFGEYEDGYM